MTTSPDPRVEAAAKALLAHSRPDYPIWEDWTSYGQERWRAEVRGILAAADEAATPSHQPHVIATVEELGALAENTVIHDARRTVFERCVGTSGGHAWVVGDSAYEPELPAIVLWEPEA